MTHDDLAQAAKDVIHALDEMPHDDNRAKHKFNLIRIAERTAADVDFDTDAAQEELLSAASYAGV